MFVNPFVVGDQSDQASPNVQSAAGVRGRCSTATPTPRAAVIAAIFLASASGAREWPLPDMLSGEGCQRRAPCDAQPSMKKACAVVAQTFFVRSSVGLTIERQSPAPGAERLIRRSAPLRRSAAIGYLVPGWVPPQSSMPTDQVGRRVFVQAFVRVGVERTGVR